MSLAARCIACTPEQEEGSKAKQGKNGVDVREPHEYKFMRKTSSANVAFGRTAEARGEKGEFLYLVRAKS